MSDTPWYERNSVLWVATFVVGLALFMLQPFMDKNWPTNVRGWLSMPQVRYGLAVGAGVALFIGGYMLGRRRRQYSGPKGDHFLAVGEAERAQALKEGYSEDGLNDGLACYVSPSPGDDLVPLYRLWHEGRFDHFYTKDARERDEACQELGYIDKGLCSYVHNTHVPGTAPLYRLWRAEPSGGDQAFVNFDRPGTRKSVGSTRGPPSGTGRTTAEHEGGHPLRETDDLRSQRHSKSQSGWSKASGARTSGIGRQVGNTKASLPQRRRRSWRPGRRSSVAGLQAVIRAQDFVR